MMRFKTISEQKLEALQALRRPLSDEESDELRRSMHAIYMRDRRLAQHRKAELALLEKLRAEAKMRSRFG